MDAVRDRAIGESALDAVTRFLGDGAEHAAEDGVGETIAVTARMVMGSPTLRARQEEILADRTQALVELLAAQTGTRTADPSLQAAAHAIKGVQRVVLDSTRRAALAGERGAELGASVRAALHAAADVVGSGLRDYARRAGPRS